MRQITKDIQITIDGSPVGFRLSKLDAFSGVMLLRLLMRVEEKIPRPTMLDLVASLSEAELRSVMTAVLNHVSVLRRWARWQKNSQDPSRMALGTLTIQDAAGGFCIVCTGVTLQKVPDRAFDRTGTNLTYTLLAATITEQ